MYESLAKKIKNLNGKTLIVTDFDEDGKASGFLMKKILERLNVEYSIFIKYNLIKDLNKVNELIKKDYKNVIFLDSPFNDDSLIKLAKQHENINFIYIDHHKREIPKNLPNNLFYFDLEAMGIHELCTTSIVYRIGKILFEDFGIYSLHASFGAIGDVVLQNDEILKKDLEKYYNHIYLNGSFYPTFFKLFDIFSSLNPLDAIEFLDKNLDISKIDKKILDKYINFNKKFSDNIKSIKIFYESDKILAIVAKSSKILANYFKLLYPNKIILVASKLKINFIDNFITRYYKISVRGNIPNFDLGKILSQYPKKISAGGHKVAAGIVIQKKYFLDLIKYIEEKLP